MVKDRPAFFYTFALATGVLLYAEWPFIAGVLDLLTVAVATVLVVTAILFIRPKGRLSNYSLVAAVLCAGILSGVVLASVNNRSKEREGAWWGYVESGASALRGKMIDKLKANGVEGDELSVVSAMCLGERKMIDRSLRNDYSRAGVAHLLALSGTHLSIIYFVLTVLLGRHSVLSRFVTVGAIWCYVVIVGFPVSAVRASVMLSLFSMADVIRRGHDRFDVLVCAVLVMLIVNPMNLYDIGFQLSVLSVGGIIFICPVLNGLLPMDFIQSHNMIMKLWSAVTVGVAAQMATAPLVAYYFGTFPCWFILSNLVAVPLATFILYGMVIVVALSPFAAAQAILLKVVGAMAWLLNTVLGEIAGWPMASIDVLDFSPVQVALCYVLMILFVRLVNYLQLK